VVEDKKIPIAKRSKPQVLGPICGPIQSVGKKFSDTYKLELLENLRVHPIVHIVLFKPIYHDASRPNRKHNSRLPPDLIHNEREFEVEVVFKPRQLRGQNQEYLVKWKRYHPI
jgi:hypothetical protein